MGLLSRTKKLFAGSNETAPAKKKSSRGKTSGASARSQKAAPAPAPAEKEAAQITASRLAGQIGLQLLVSEKSMKEQAGNVVAFRVKPSASKQQIMVAVKEQYGVTPLRVRTLRFLPKNRRRGATSGSTNAWKKAYVKVDDIQKINVAP